MSRYFEYKDDKSSKFWEVTLSDNRIFVRYGRIGANGQTQEKTFDSAATAAQEAEKLIKKKTKEGYQEMAAEENRAAAAPQATATQTIQPSTEPEVPERSADAGYAPFQLLSCAEVYRRYGKELKLDKKPVSGYVNADTAGYVLFCYGNAQVNGHLYLEGGEKMENVLPAPLGDGSLAAVMVTGDLHITGSLINHESYDPPLWVGGSVKAKNILSGNSFIFIDGDAEAEEVLAGHYNDGSIAIGKTLTTQVLYEDDHDITYKKKKVALRYNLEKLLSKKIFRQDLEDWEDAKEALARGENLFAASFPIDDITEEGWIKALGKNGKKIKLVPAGKLTTAICLAAVTTNEAAVKLIPATDRTEAVYLEAARRNGRVINCLPAKAITDEMYVTAVDTYPEIITGMPERLLTPEICKKAVRKNFFLLPKVPLDILNKEIVSAAIENNLRIQYCPEVMRTPDIVRAIIVNNPGELEALPPEYLYDEEMHILAAQSGYTLKLYGKPAAQIYERMDTSLDEIVSEAVRRAGLDCMRRLPWFAVTGAVFDLAEKLFAGDKQWEALKEEKRKQEIGMFTNRVTRWLVYWTQEEMQEYLTQVNANDCREIFERIPGAWVTRKLMEKGCRYIYDIEHKWLPEDLVLRYVVQQRDGGYLPDWFYTEAVAMANSAKTETPEGLSNGSALYLKYVPVAARTEKVCKAIDFSCRRECLGFVPVYLQETIFQEEFPG